MGLLGALGMPACMLNYQKGHTVPRKCSWAYISSCLALLGPGVPQNNLAEMLSTQARVDPPNIIMLAYTPRDSPQRSVAFPRLDG